MARAIFQYIYSDLKQAIENGDCPFMEYLPSERELTSLYGCSHMTVRRAIAQLAADSYVQSQQGRGVRVIFNSGAEPPRASNGIETFTEAAIRRGFEMRIEIGIFELLEADERIAKMTGFPEGSELTRVKRIRYADDMPVSTDDSYYLSSTVPDLTPEIARHGMYNYLEGVLHIQIATGTRTITIEHPTREDERCLDLGDFDAVAVMRGPTFNSDGEIMEYTETRQTPTFFALYETVTRSKNGPARAGITMYR